MNSTTRWHILGAGAIGTLIAATLSAAGVDCQLLTHRRYAQSRRWVDGERETHIPVQPIGAQPRKSLQGLIITTKAFAQTDALRAALPWLASDAQVISCANGMGFEAACEALLAGRPLLRAITTEAALRDNSGRVLHTGEGKTLVGGTAGPEPGWFLDSLARAPRWHWCPDMDAAVQGKFAVNCVINPLTAQYACRNGQLLEGDRQRELAALCEETQAAMAALGMWHGGVSLYARAAEVCAKTAANRSSMLQDRLAGRRTELEFLNGYLISRAAAANIQVPLNQELMSALA